MLNLRLNIRIGALATVTALLLGLSCKPAGAPKKEAVASSNLEEALKAHAESRGGFSFMILPDLELESAAIASACASYHGGHPMAGQGFAIYRCKDGQRQWAVSKSKIQHFKNLVFEQDPQKLSLTFRLSHLLTDVRVSFTEEHPIHIKYSMDDSPDAPLQGPFTEHCPSLGLCAAAKDVFR